MSPPTKVPGAGRTFLRSLAIQGSWNERTMLGGGFGFSLLPILRRRFAGDPEALREAVDRHLGHFNAHPYLASLALGAIGRMEAEGAPPEDVRRFKKALRSPLGALGDRLVWAGVLPLTLLLGVLAALLGASPLGAVLLFLVPYNAVHLVLRAWGFRAGLRSGREVVVDLRNARLGERAERVRRWLPLFLGAVGGAAAARLLVAGAVSWAPVVLGGLAVGAGYLWGRTLLRPLLGGTALAGIVLILLGVLP